MKHDDTIRRLTEKAYLLGFNAAGEGYNGEFPFEQRGIDPETDSNWTEQRELDLKAVMEIVK
jgi:hypothetical protein